MLAKSLSLSQFFSLSAKQPLQLSQSCWTRMGPRGTRDHLFRALSTFRKLLPTSTVLSKMQPSCVVLDIFRQTIHISNKFGNVPTNHVLPPVDFEPLWVWARPFVSLHLFPVELSPSPPLKASTSQSLRTDIFVVQPCHMSSPAEHTISDGHQYVHVAFLDPPMTSPVPESPPLSQLHSWWSFHSNSIRHHSRAPARNFVSLCLDRRPDTRAPEESLPHRSLYDVQPQQSGKPVRECVSS